MFNKRKNKKTEAGFTILELMAVVFVVSIGMIAVMNWISQAFLHARVIRSKLIAAYLAEEGIEIVRNIRDTNWVEGDVWNSGIGTSGDFEMQYDDIALSNYTGRYLKINEAGFYNYSLGSDTKFKRKISINTSVNEEISVLVTVSFQEMGKDFEVKALEKLKKWR